MELLFISVGMLGFVAIAIAVLKSNLADDTIFWLVLFCIFGSCTVGEKGLNHMSQKEKMETVDKEKDDD